MHKTAYVSLMAPRLTAFAPSAKQTGPASWQWSSIQAAWAYCRLIVDLHVIAESDPRPAPPPVPHLFDRRLQVVVLLGDSPLPPDDAQLALQMDRRRIIFPVVITSLAEVHSARVTTMLGYGITGYGQLITDQVLRAAIALAP